MASSINASTSGAGGVITTADNTGILNLQTASTTAVTVDASQNVGIGTTSPTAKLTVNGNQSFAEKTAAYIGVDIATTAGNGGNLTIKAGNGSGSGNTSGNLYIGAGRGSVSATSGFIAFGTAQATNAVGLDAEYMRINSSGNVGIGNNGASLSYLLDITTPTAQLMTSRLARMPSDSAFSLGFRNGVTGGISGTEIGRMNWSYNGTDSAYISAERNGGTGANRINVVCNMSAGVFLSAGGTSWGSLSDERQKTNLEPIVDASNKLNTLRTVTGRYITDEETVSRAFLIAQDVQKVLPEAVDAQEDEDGTLGLRYTDLIPLLIAGFKEQQTIINDLKARVTALEVK